MAKTQAVTPETLADYAITVHGLTGSSYNLGAEYVGDLAAALERAAKTGDFAFVQAQNPFFLEAEEKLLAALTAKLETLASPKPKSGQNGPDPALLEALRRACETFDVEGMDQAMKSLTSYDYHPGPGADLMAWLEEKTYRLDFKRIARRLAESRQPNWPA